MFEEGRGLEQPWACELTSGVIVDKLLFIIKNF